MAKSARQAQIEKAALYPLDWVEERSGLVGYTSGSCSGTSPATSTGCRRSGRRR